MSISDFIDLDLAAKLRAARPPPPPPIIGEIIGSHPLGYSLRRLYLAGTEERHDVVLDLKGRAQHGLDFGLPLFDYPAPYRSHVVLWWPDATRAEIKAEVDRIADAVKVSAALSWLASQCRPWHKILITHEGSGDAPSGR